MLNGALQLNANVGITDLVSDKVLKLGGDLIKITDFYQRRILGIKNNGLNSEDLSHLECLVKITEMLNHAH